jgi:hypothetical protein
MVSENESPRDSLEYTSGLHKLIEERAYILADYNGVEYELKELKAELDRVDKEIVKFKESFGIKQNVR